MSLPDGVYGVGQIQVRANDGNNIVSNSTFMGSMIAPYRPAYPTFELIDNSNWRISMMVPMDHQATITSENLPIPLILIGNSYHRIEFELEATTTSINVELTNGDISSTTTYKLPIQPPAITPSNLGLTDDDVIIFLNVSNDELEQYQQDYIFQFSYDGGLNWLQVTSPDWRIELEDGIYSPGSLLFRFVVEEIDSDTSEIVYRAYGPSVATFHLFVPYRPINLRAEELSGEPGGTYTYKITGVGPIGADIHILNPYASAIMDSKGEFTMMTFTGDPFDSFSINAFRDYIQTGTYVPVIPQCSVESASFLFGDLSSIQDSSKMIMGFAWNSITADSSTCQRPLITIIGLNPSVHYEIINIKSYEGVEAIGTPTIVTPIVKSTPPFNAPPYSLSGMTDSEGTLRYVIQPDPNQHPYTQLLVEHGVVSSIHGSGVNNSKIVTFEVEVIIDGVNRKFTDSLAYYGMIA